MEEDLQKLRNAAKKKLENKILEAYNKFDVKTLVSHIEQRLIGEAEDITDKLLGIDRRWSDVEIKDGRLRAIIQPEIDRILEEKAAPAIRAEVARVMELKSIQTAIQKAIKARIQNAIYNLEHYNSDIGKKIDELMKAETDKIFAEYTKPSQQD